LWKLQDSQAVYVIEGEKVTPTAHDKGLAREIGSWTFSELRERISIAENRGSRGEVTPVPD
jgi:hypothetical protein